MSTYSVVAAAPDEPAPCTETRITCRAPWQDVDGNWGRAGRWVRYEQRLEGAARYWTIARAIAYQCELEVERADDGPFADSVLAALLVTVSYHEGGLRRDVHAGEGKWSRGDQGRSWSLYQLLLGPSRRAEVLDTGLMAYELVGIDDGATGRATAVAGDALGRLARGCASEPFCVFGRYGGVAQPVGHKGIRARVVTFGRVRRLLAEPPALPDDIRVHLGIGPAS